jgi:succinate dehydrogenase / fumarate reductase membrane anchor subunit
MSNSPNTDVAIMRSMLGRARGLGSAKSGTGHWWAQRVTALALLPLTLWFIAAVIGLAGRPQAEVAEWARSPLVTTFLLALIAATFHHMQLGLQTVIEDYMHNERSKLASLLAMRAAVVLLALTAAVSVLKLAFAG